MAYEGCFRCGANEVINNYRARGIATTATCPMVWLKGPRCLTLQDALGDPAYTADNLPTAPWYDLSIPDVSGRFYGVFALSVAGLNDSTRSASVTEGIDDGAVVGRTRKGSRQVRVRAMLLARGRDALDYGVAWLNASLDPDACGQHGTGCGSTDLEFLTDCPPARSIGASDDEYAARVEPYRRFLHNVTVTSGPYERELMNRGEFWGQIFEWTFTAGRPWVYSTTRAVELPVTPTVVIQDTPYNLAPYPSAELASAGAVDVATNYSANPSLETNATGWAASASALSGTAPAAYFTSGRITGELAANGLASFRARILGNGSTEVASSKARVLVEHTVTFAPGAQRVSFTCWAAALIVTGAGVSSIDVMRAQAQWYVGATPTGAPVALGTATPAEISGRVFALKSQAPPAGATSVRVQLFFDVTWRSSATAANNSDIRLYSDAVGVTIP
jgi:hypothetical protein